VTVHGVALVGHDLVANSPLPPFPCTPVMSLLPCAGSYCKIATFGAGSGKDGNKPGKRSAGNQEALRSTEASPAAAFLAFELPLPLPQTVGCYHF